MRIRDRDTAPGPWYVPVMTPIEFLILGLILEAYALGPYRFDRDGRAAYYEIQAACGRAWPPGWVFRDGPNAWASRAAGAA
jgi:hypothetical protein